ncbi:chemotaxis protein CheB [Microcoleus sp. LEGE 07076]|uniref:chemotaxis protein CheB n=1 Tax=Microcoleus sp. LEGE 07076 TaxID=915322 RepID=UPI00187DEF81|nr:chemotaxis protein CheB [Microcoleus sp. LEGE 07076]MBE9184787.1 chemotaxis protein CheB [Microcoleus sp. LEGE 07076]
MRNHNIVVVGASAGGVEALQRLFSQFPADLQASFFVVLHISPESPSILGSMIDKASPLTAKRAEDGERIQAGHIYVAPPDMHLLLKPGYIRLHRGPKENRHRPAIDPLFRSAAIAYRAQTVGVILTGYLDDGTSGLLAIKRCGGIAVVQDPEDADYPDMPRNAIAEVEVDYRLPLHKMGSVIRQIVEQPAALIDEVPQDIVIEAEIAEQTMSNIKDENKIGHLVPVSCPECGGPLWRIDADRVRRYRCHVGHGFTAKALLADQDAALEQALWAAMRTMEERANMALTMAKDEEARGRSRSGQAYREQATTSKAHAQVIRKLLVEGV